MPESRLLIADIGGTHARFALVSPEEPGYRAEQQLLCADFPNPETAIRAYLQQTDCSRLDAICIAAAGPVRNGQVTLTNNQWSLSETALAMEFSCARIQIVNDFAATARALPLLEPSQLVQIAGKQLPDLDREDCRVAVIGPGTGLGAACLWQAKGVTRVQVTEAGHTAFAPIDERQRAILLSCVRHTARVSYEHLLSGPGIQNLLSALAMIRGLALPTQDVSTLFQLARDRDNPLATETVALYFELLAQFASDFALASGSFDGVYFCGGVLQKQGDLMDPQNFASSFRAAGPLQDILGQIPLCLIRHAQPGLLGASAMARELCR